MNLFPGRPATEIHPEELPRLKELGRSYHTINAAFKNNTVDRITLEKLIIVEAFGKNRTMLQRKLIGRLLTEISNELYDALGIDRKLRRGGSIGGRRGRPRKNSDELL